MKNVYSLLLFTAISLLLITTTVSGQGTRYWVGDGGNWSDPNHWATTSGGTGGAGIPTGVDSVVFDALSFSSPAQTVLLNSGTAYCKNMEWTNVGFMPTFSCSGSQTLEIGGSLLFSTNMNVNLDSLTIYFNQSVGGPYSVNTANLPLNLLKEVKFYGSGGTVWQLQSDLIIPDGGVVLEQGILQTNGRLVKCSKFKTQSVWSKNLDISNSTIEVSDTFDLSAVVGSFATTGSVIHLNNFSTSVSFLGAGQVFNEVRIGANANCQMSGNNTFYKVAIDSGATWNVMVGDTQQFNNLITKGSLTDSIKIMSSTSGTTVNIMDIDGGRNCLDFVSIRDINASGAIFYVGENSTLLSGTIGFTPITALDGSIVSKNVKCAGANDGSAKVIATGGDLSYAYYWQPIGISSDSISPLSPDTYTVTVTDGNGTGCYVFTKTVTITEPAPLNIGTITPMDPSCSGACNGSAIASPTGGVSPYTYSWSNGETTPTASALCGNMNHTITVTDTMGCSLNQSFWVNPGSPLTFSLSTFPPTCDMVCNGGATVTAQSGIAPYTYAWSNGETSQTANALCGNMTHTVTLTDSSGCSSFQSSWINPGPSLTFSLSTASPTCDMVCNGSATVTPQSGTAPYTYSWTNGETAQTALALCGNMSHTITLTDVDGCTSFQSPWINPGPTFNFNITGLTDPSCESACNGTATVNPSSGTAPYTYSWSSGETTQTALALCGNMNFTVTLTDSSGCFSTQIPWMNPGPPLTATVSITDPSCFGTCNAMATPTPLNGNAPYNYVWLHGETNQTASNLCGNNSYTVTIEDVNGCTLDKDVWINPGPPPLTANVNTVNVKCSGANDGEATVTANGGVNPYAYLWSDGQTSQIASNLAQGSYSVTVTDINNCTIAIDTTITEPPLLVIDSITSADVICAGANNGTAKAFASGGTASYNYSWSNGETYQMAINLSAGTHTVTVKDANNCMVWRDTTINEPSLLIIDSITTTDVLCAGGNNGTATVFASGGTSSYNYSWSNGELTQMAINLAAGTHTVTVKDANNCMVWSNTTILEPSPLTVMLSPKGASCSGTCDAVITSTVNGGVGPYTYLWLPSSQTTLDASGLCAGNYSLTVTDFNGCTVTNQKFVGEPAPLSVSINKMDVMCYGACDGSGNALPTGGSGPITFSWMPTAQTNPLAINLCAGTHSVTVSDSLGCSITDSIIINQPLALLMIDSISITNVPCAGGNNGTAKAFASGGTAPYNYSWSNGETYQMAINLSAGTHTVTVKDANNCMVWRDTTIIEPSLLKIDSIITTNVLCAGDNNGTATVYASGGTTSYNYSWSNGELTQIANNLTAGTHTITVKDANNCLVWSNASITEPSQALTISVTTTSVNCFGGSDGTITSSVTGGTQPYNYLWSDGQSAQVANNLFAGVYTLTVTDDNLCTSVKVDSITEPQVLTVGISITDISCFGKNDGSATAVVNGGTLPYNYSWSDGQTTQVANNLAVGAYSLTVNDLNNCMSIQVDSISEPAAITVSITATDVKCKGGNDGASDAIVAGGIGPYNFVWSDGQTMQKAINLIQGVYTVTVSDVNSCAIVDSATITEPLTVINGTTTPIDDGCSPACDGSITSSITGGTPAYSYLWSPGGQITQDASGLCQGTYSLTVTDANGCIFVLADTIKEKLTSLITGTVAYSGGNVNNGYVKLFEYAFGAKMIMKDSVQLASGTYTFSNVANGSYVIYAKADTQLVYKNTIGTYFLQTSRWDSAKIVTIPCDSMYLANITLLETVPLSGKGVITGTVVEGPGYGKSMAQGDPIDGKDVEVEQVPGGGIIARTTTDSNGVFLFTKIPVGNYRVYIDIPGLPMDSTYIINITPTDTLYEDVNFVADSNSINADPPIAQYVAKMKDNSIIKVYPNPYANYTNIEFELAHESEIRIEVYTLLGEKVNLLDHRMVSPGRYKNRFSAQELGYPSGVYLMRITINGESSLVKLVETH